jgi:AraC-like DNA-binding protein
MAASIESEFQHLQNDSSHLLRATLYQLLIILNRHYASAYKLQSDTHIHPDFFRFRSLLEKQFKNYHRVDFYTKTLRVSSTHLNKLCRQYSGFSTQQMIHQKLISEIKKLLRSNLSIKEIAYEFDFSDPSNFNRFFKKLTGATAQHFRGNP